MEILKNVIVNNLDVIGNCLGSTGDLAGAVADCGADRLAIPMDSSFSGSDGARFVERTLNAPDRVGKVVYLY